VRDLPPKLMLKSSNVVSANRVTTILERCYKKAAAFEATHSIGFVQRAAFANAFRWRMDDLGYPKELITVATEGLLVHLQKSKKSAKA
jgi:acyl-coenzyme A synthetase/AMP-(fatty) acid ligase